MSVKRRRSLNGEPQRYFAKVVLAYDGTECLIWPFARTKRGYGHMKYGGQTRTIHRLLCEIANGPGPTAGHQAAHSCGKGHLGCVAKRHLSWKTRDENMADMVAHGNSQRGERHPVAKLTEVDVARIFALKASMSQCEIAKMFGVSDSRISEILAGKSWAWFHTETVGARA